MARSVWKGVYISKVKSKQNKKILNRRSNICKSMLNKSFFVDNGLKLKSFFITISNINSKAGEFFFTRKFKKRIK